MITAHNLKRQKKQQLRQARNLRGGGGEVSPALFRKLEKSALIWRKNAMIVVIYGYNFSIKMKFLRVSRGKPVDFFPVGPFFLVLQVNVYRSALIRRKVPCPKKFLVTCLKNNLNKNFEKNGKQLCCQMWNQICIWNFIPATFLMNGQKSVGF